ncbi:hypothetical protein NXY56_005285 [Leishmania guyanensis]
MECLIFAARYQPEARTLEFNLTAAPLVDVVTDVTVAPCGGAAPLWRSPATQQGLFYGRNTFLLDRPLRFADDRIALVCSVRVRQQRLSTLAVLAADVLCGNADGWAMHSTSSQDTREYTFLLTAVSNAGRCGVQDNSFVYFTSQDLPPLMEGASTTIVSPLLSEPPITHLTYACDWSPPSSLLALSAHALCYL